MVRTACNDYRGNQAGADYRSAPGWGADPSACTRAEAADARARATAGKRGVTLLEMLIVTLIIALLAGIAYPSAAAGIESMRLRSAGNDIASFLTAAADQAERREQMVEIWISAKDNALIARSPDLGFARRYDLPQAIRITSILPAAEAGPDEPRRFLLYPGGTVPRIGVEIVSESGRKRMIVVDPLSGLPRNEAEGQ